MSDGYGASAPAEPIGIFNNENLLLTGNGSVWDKSGSGHKPDAHSMLLLFPISFISIPTSMRWGCPCDAKRLLNE
jgi:hypothetical protein